MAKILNILEVDCELQFGRECERVLKTIKSEFGDVVLIITNFEIYEVEIDDIGEGYTLNLKPYKVEKAMMSARNGRLSKREGAKASNICEEIEDVRFMSNGLKLMILTTDEQVIVIEAHNFLFGQDLKELMFQTLQ